MYLEHFHLTEFPFSISPDPHFFYKSKRHQDGLAHLVYGIEFGGGFVVLTGEVGTGKTTLCHCLLEQLPDNLDIALVLNSKLSALELVATICDELSVHYDYSNLSLKQLIDKLNKHLLLAHSKGRKTVILIDEAQNLSIDILEQLRLLTNLETSKSKLLRIILIGQPELKVVLQTPSLRQLNQRITARYHLLPLSYLETKAYIKYRLLVSMGDINLIDESAIRKVYQLSLGTPRLINLLCDRSLLGAYSMNMHKVNSTIVTKAGEEIIPASKKKYFDIKIFSSLTCILLLTFTSINSSYFSISPINTIINREDDLHNIINEVNPSIINKIPINSKEIKFTDWLVTPMHYLDNVILDALHKWSKNFFVSQKINCDSIKSTGLSCFMGKGTWKEVLQIKRPVILEFVLNNKKYHSLLTGFNHDQTNVQLNGNFNFSVSEVLKYWEGYYLTFEVPNLNAAKIISYGQSSENVLWLRYVLNSYDGMSCLVEQPLFFDDVLSKRVLRFQHERHLTEDGKVGPQTLVSLKKFAQKLEYTHLNIVE